MGSGRLMHLNGKRVCGEILEVAWGITGNNELRSFTVRYGIRKGS